MQIFIPALRNKITAISNKCKLYLMIFDNIFQHFTLRKIYVNFCISFCYIDLAFLHQNTAVLS